MKKIVNDKTYINQQSNVLFLQLGDQGCEIVELETTNTEKSKLTDEEREELDECEQNITAGLDTFVRVGCSLAHIRNKRLYRENYSRFED
jgi:hypothetical protein